MIAYVRAGQSPISDCHSVVDDMKIAYAVGSGLELSGIQIPDVVVDNARLVWWSLPGSKSVTTSGAARPAGSSTVTLRSYAEILLGRLDEVDGQALDTVADL